MVGLDRQELGRFLRWVLKHYDTVVIDGMFCYMDSMGVEVSIEHIIEHYSKERELTYEERVRWFFVEYYETGMELPSMLGSLKDADLDNFEWYDEIIKFPKYERDL
jgi:hypothetical protein